MRPPEHHRAPGLIAPGSGAEPVGSLLVEHDHAELRYDDGTYRATMRRKLVNNGEHPITLPAGVQPIPVEQYRGTGTGWRYHERGAIR